MDRRSQCRSSPCWLSFCVLPSPPDQRELQGQSEPDGPEGDAGVAFGVLGHPDVGGHDGDEQENETPGGGASGLGDHEAEATGDFGGAADEDQLAVGGEVVGHDAGVCAREDEVERAGGDVERAHEEAGEAHRGLIIIRQEQQQRQQQRP